MALSVCRVSVVEESVRKEQCESTDSFALFSAEGPSAPVTGSLISQAEKSLHHQWWKLFLQWQLARQVERGLYCVLYLKNCSHTWLSQYYVVFSLWRTTHTADCHNITSYSLSDWGTTHTPDCHILSLFEELLTHQIVPILCHILSLFEELLTHQFIPMSYSLSAWRSTYTPDCHNIMWYSLSAWRTTRTPGFYRACLEQLTWNGCKTKAFSKGFGHRAFHWKSVAGCGVSTCVECWLF